MAKRGYRTIKLDLPKSELKLYGSNKLMDAVKTMTEDMTLYQGVRFAQILEAVYKQGKNDGAREAFQEVNKNLKLAQKTIPHKRPGRPQKSR